MWKCWKYHTYIHDFRQINFKDTQIQIKDKQMTFHDAQIYVILRSLCD